MPSFILSEDYSVKLHFFFQTLSFQVEITCSIPTIDKTLGWIWAESYNTCKIHVNSVNPEDMIRTSFFKCKINAIWGWPKRSNNCLWSFHSLCSSIKIAFAQMKT